MLAEQVVVGDRVRGDRRALAPADVPRGDEALRRRQRGSLRGRTGGRSACELVDANQHVDREAAARAGVGFYGKNTLMITRRTAPGSSSGRSSATRSSRRRRRSTPTAAPAGSASTRARPAHSTSRATLDATRCLSYWTQAPAPIPEREPRAARDRVYGCDICQDVCPWNRGVEKRRAGEQLRRSRPSSRSSTGSERDAGRAAPPLRPALRPAQRRALPAPQRARRAREHGRRASTLAVAAYASRPTTSCSPSTRVGGRPDRGARREQASAAGDRALGSLGAASAAVLVAALEVAVFTQRLPPGYETAGLGR